MCFVCLQLLLIIITVFILIIIIITDVLTTCGLLYRVLV